MSAVEIVTLTRTQPDLIGQAAKLLQTVFASMGSWTTVEEAEQEVVEMLGDDRFVRVALDGDEVIGWIGGIPGYDGNVWELHPLVVKPERQRQGVGTQLIHDFEEQVARRGGLTIQLGTDDHFAATTLSQVDLYVDTWAHIRDVRTLTAHPYEFYLKMGYVIIGVMPDANGRGKPDIYMGKRIGS